MDNFSVRSSDRGSSIIVRAIDAIVKAGIDPRHSERDEIKGKLAAIEASDNVISLHPAALDRYRADLEKLASLLPVPDLADADAGELGESVRRLISAVILHTPTNSEKLEVEIRGRLGELLAAPTFMRRLTGL